MADGEGLRKKTYGGYLGTKVPKTMENEVKDLCEKWDWNQSAFLRRAIQESLDKVKTEGK